MRLAVSAIAMILAGLCGGNTGAPRGERPDVLLIVTDDQGYGDASSYGATDLPTPSFDAMAAEGARFTRFRVTPLCAPTRASLLSGLYNLENGMWRGPGRRNAEGRERRLSPDVKLLPEYLREAGYATGLFGKWHLGFEPPNLPNLRGFDEFVGFLGGWHPYRADRDGRVLRDGRPFATAAHLTDLFADQAEDFIRRHADRPFFAMVAFNAVHGPLRSSERDEDSGLPAYLDRCEALGVEQPRRDYCAVMTHADRRIGDLLALLSELGLEQRTLVVALSDNGALIEKYPGSNGPLRGEKGTTYEGGIRVPAAIRWPGVVPAGVVSRADAAHFDVFATILDAAGIEVPERNGGHRVHGTSLLPHLQSGGAIPLPERALFWDASGRMAALRGDWKIVGAIPDHGGDFDAALPAVAATQFELYDLSSDEGEQRDVAALHPDIHDDLRARYVEWFRDATR